MHMFINIRIYVVLVVDVTAHVEKIKIQLNKYA